MECDVVIYDNTIPHPTLITASTANSIRAKFFGGDDDIIQTKEQLLAYYRWLENALSKALRTPDQALIVIEGGGCQCPIQYEEEEEA